jgi:predicted component of type VI protein secretion system
VILELRVLSGACAGQQDRFEKSVVTVGRHPLCDFQLDPAEDLDVSARHAELRAAGARVVLRDTGSTNGTFVNGQRVSRECDVHSGDVISLGEYGPRLQLTVDEPSTIAETIERPAARPATMAGVDASPTRPTASRASRGTTQRLIAVMSEQVSRLQTVLAVSLLLAVGAVVLAFWLGGR